MLQIQRVDKLWSLTNFPEASNRVVLRCHREELRETLPRPQAGRACAVSPRRRLSGDRKPRPAPPRALAPPVSPVSRIPVLAGAALLHPELLAALPPRLAPPQGPPALASRPASGPGLQALAFPVRPAARRASTMVGTVTSQGGALGESARVGRLGLGWGSWLRPGFPPLLVPALQVPREDIW